MNSEYGQNSSRENSIEQRKPMAELKRMNQPSSAPENTPPQMMQPIVIQCDLPQAMNKLTEQADGINWELEEIRKTLPELKPHIDLTPVQKSLTEMQRSLTEMNKLLERVGNLSEKYSCKWIRLAAGLQPAGSPQVDRTACGDPWHGGTGGVVWRGGDQRPVPLIPAVAGLTAVGTLMDEDEDAEEKRRRMEAKIAAENFGAVIGFAAGAALAVKEKLDEQAVQEKQQQTMGGF